MHSPQLAACFRSAALLPQYPAACCGDFLFNKGELHLFDYEDTVQPLKNRLEAVGFTNITAWGCSFRYLDSYNWSLKLILERHRDVRFDYVYLDGAHTWAIDALTFFLCDTLMNVGGTFALMTMNGDY